MRLLGHMLLFYFIRPKKLFTLVVLHSTYYLVVIIIKGTKLTGRIWWRACSIWLGHVVATVVPEGVVASIHSDLVRADVAPLPLCGVSSPAVTLDNVDTELQIYNIIFKDFSLLPEYCHPGQDRWCHHTDRHSHQRWWGQELCLSVHSGTGPGGCR